LLVVESKRPVANEERSEEEKYFRPKMEMKKALRIVAFAGASLLLCGCPKKQVQSQGAATQTTYSHDAHGLEQEFEPFLEAYARGNADAQDRAFGNLAIPEAGKWLATYFPRPDVEQLGWDYEAEVDTYKKSLINVMRTWGSAKRFRAHCKATDRTNHTGLQPRVDSVKPTQQVPVEQFEIEFVSEDGKKFSELANFVYSNGAYRYVGKGAYPFWSMPDATRK
jgi:hypothetical protein